ncbi:MAG: ATP-binding protein [Oscillospiraceae bacterium]|nr:ATP-binding protein [Oscillospiraceae bacterium]
MAIRLRNMGVDGVGFVKALAKAHESTNPPLEGDYTEAGLLYCGQCHTAKRSRIDIGGEELIVPVWCECMIRADDEERHRNEMILTQMRSTELRGFSLMGQSLENCTFENADRDGDNRDSFVKCRRFAEKFGAMLSDGRGLLLFGDVGTGKTYSAACIANALLSQGRSVIMTSLVTLIESGTNDVLSRLNSIDLLILDDLGAERSTDYALERVYSIVDGRYRSNKPVIYTTNLSLEELKHPVDIRYQRIYDRVLERCYPVEFRGISRRKRGAWSGFEAMNRLLNED